MSERRFAEFLLESFATLERDLPAVHARLCRHFAGRIVELCVDGESLRLAFTTQHAVRSYGNAVASIRITTDRDTILDLVDARLGLVDAIMADRLELTGSPDELLLFHDGLMIYLHGAVRAPGFPHILHTYRHTYRRWQRSPVGSPPTGPATKEVPA